MHNGARKLHRLGLIGRKNDDRVMTVLFGVLTESLLLCNMPNVMYPGGDRHGADEH